MSDINTTNYLPVEDNPIPIPATELEKLPPPSDTAGDAMFCQEVNTSGNDVVDFDNVKLEPAEGSSISIPIPTLPPTTSSSDLISFDATAGATASAGATAAASKPSSSSSSSSSPIITDQQNNFRSESGYESWNDMLYQLLLYKARKGDVNIPDNDVQYRSLYDWIQTQREQYTLYQQDETSSTVLNADRVAVLESIDIQCTVRGERIWQSNFDDLVAYKKENGDVRVPRQYEKAPKLAEWVTDQRRQCKARLEGKPSTMTAERMAKLDQLGFVWQFRDRMDWNERYEKLLEYKKENGHCIVPQNYMKSNSLGKWVAKQREQYCYYQEGKHSFLTEERIDLLNSIGFVWRLKGKGVNKNNNNNNNNAMSSTNPMMHTNIPKPQTAIQRKLVAKMKEEEKKLVELKSAMSIIANEEYNKNTKMPALSTTTTTMGGASSEFLQSGLQRGGGGVGGGDGVVGNPNPNANHQTTFPSMSHHSSAGHGHGHGSWLC